VAETALRVVWKGQLSTALRATNRYLCLEGAIRSAKTTNRLWAELNAALEYPGIKSLICRWTDDATDSLLKPLWRDTCTSAGVSLVWNAEEHHWTLPNGSVVYCHGLKPSDETRRYGKLRGKTLARIYLDQAEELPHDFWPELQGRLSQQGYPQQLSITPQSVDEDHWIATEFPESNPRGDYLYLPVSLYDNAHNLDPAYVASLEAAYPPGHPKRRTLIEGRRGLNVIGKAVYAGYFDRARHLVPCAMNPHLPLYEAIDFGKHHPCVIWGQVPIHGGWHLLGGVMGKDIGLTDFAPLVLRYRAHWFPNPLEIASCCDPAGTVDNSHGTQTALQLLQDKGIYPKTVESSNHPPVRLACIDALMDDMRRRTPVGEAFQCHPDRWLVIDQQEALARPFVPHALEGGYTESPHRVTVGRKLMTVPLKDGFYEHGMNCLEYLQVNFGSTQPSQIDIDRQQEQRVNAAVRRAQRDADPGDVRVRLSRGRRGGY